MFTHIMDINSNLSQPKNFIKKPPPFLSFHFTLISFRTFDRHKKFIEIKFFLREKLISISCKGRNVVKSRNNRSECETIENFFYIFSFKLKIGMFFTRFFHVLIFYLYSVLLYVKQMEVGNWLLPDPCEIRWGYYGDFRSKF